MSKTDDNDHKNSIGTIKNLHKETGNGNIELQYNLALLYENGEGTEKNLEKAFYWYQKAAENGYIDAQYNLALLHDTEKNLEKAFYWYQKAAKNGYIDAQYNLASLYYD